MAETGPLTSEVLWRATVIAALIDASLLLLLARGVSPELFARLKWHLAGAACFVYAALWGTVGSVIFWETVYRYIFPAWSRWLLPVGFGLLYGALAVVFWRVSTLAPRWQAVWFSLLGGLVSVAGHTIGISLGLLQVPLLAGASAVSALAFGVFEFIFYGCAIVGLAAAARWVGLRVQPVPG